MAEDSTDVEENRLSCEWRYDGSAATPNGEGRTVLKNGAQRTHRVLDRDEFKQKKPARWFELELHGSVRVISKEILNMRHLTALFASHNLLKTIPAQINYLHHLSILDLSHNKLVALPRELGDIANLLHLNLSDNELASLPVELGKLYKIKTLNVSGNPLPKEVLSYGSTPHGSRNLQQYLLDSLSKTISKPPPRDWFAIKTLTNNGKPVAQFKVLCYNVLCDTYTTPSLYSYCPLWALNWEYRKNIIMKEILTYDADILGLHEVEAEQFRVFYEPELKARGYDGIFSPKSRSKTMSKDNQKHVDGCALFWRTSKFKIRQQHLVEFAQIAINKSHQSEAIINRVMPKDNIALLATMEILPGIYVEPGQHPLNVKNDKVSSDKIDQNDQIIGTPLVLCAAHTHWDPEYCDVKLIQSMMLIHECAKQIEHTAKDFSLPLEEVPLIICGDFNSLPESGVVQYLINASVPKAHTDLKSFCNNIVLDGINTNEYDSTHYSHSLKLESSIDVNECINTNVTPDFKGMIDYILTTPHSLDRVGFLGGIWPNWIRENNLIGFPHPHVPSDHIPIMASYILKPRTERSPTRECKRFRRTSESFKKDMETRKK